MAKAPRFVAAFIRQSHEKLRYLIGRFNTEQHRASCQRPTQKEKADTKVPAFSSESVASIQATAASKPSVTGRFSPRSSTETSLDMPGCSIVTP